MVSYLSGKRGSGSHHAQLPSPAALPLPTSRWQACLCPCADHHLSGSPCSPSQAGEGLGKGKRKAGRSPRSLRDVLLRSSAQPAPERAREQRPTSGTLIQSPRPSPPEAELAPKCHGPLPVPAGPDSASWSAWQSCPPSCPLRAAGTKPWAGFRGGAKGHNPRAGTRQQGNKKWL